MYATVCYVLWLYWYCDYSLIVLILWLFAKNKFQSSWPEPTHLSTVYHTLWRLPSFSFNAELQAGKLGIPIFIFFGFRSLVYRFNNLLSTLETIGICSASDGVLTSHIVLWAARTPWISRSNSGAPIVPELSLRATDGEKLCKTEPRITKQVNTGFVFYMPTFHAWLSLSVPAFYQVIPTSAKWWKNRARKEFKCRQKDIANKYAICAVLS